MKVVLIDEVPNLGIAGDVRDVKGGYARNHLIPKRLAVLATAQELARAESRRTHEVTRRAHLNEEMSVVVERLTEERLLIPVRVGPGGRLYGSVTAAEIAEVVGERIGKEVDRRTVELGQPIREQGHHEVRVRLAPDVVPTVMVTVYPEGTEPPSLEEAVEAPETEEPTVEEVLAAVEEEETATAEASETPEASVALEEEEEEAPDEGDETASKEDADDAPEQSVQPDADEANDDEERGDD